MKDKTSEILLISDLHLSVDRPDIIRLFCSLVNQRAIYADALYILGDFFEYWIGDDDPAEELSDIFNAFSTLHQHNVPVYFQHGNRDFLAAKQFADRAHCELISDPYIARFYGEPVILMHGDSLCTDDIKYQEFKKIVRSELWQNDFLAKPLEERRAIVEDLRQRSKSETSDKEEDIMDVNQQAVLSLFTTYDDVRFLIHGHTHRPDIHQFSVNSLPCHRIVLGDWYNKGSLLSIQPNNDSSFTFKLESFKD